MGCSKSKLDKKDTPGKELEFNFEENISPEKIDGEKEEDPIMKELKQSIPIISIQENYTFSKKIAGQGSFGVVRMVHPKNNESLIFALKSIQKEKVKKTIKILKREVYIMKAIDHPNIVKLYRVYQDHFFFHLLLEYCSGGELLERIIQNPRFSETYATTVIKSMIYALKYLHGMNVCHRDLSQKTLYSRILILIPI